MHFHTSQISRRALRGLSLVELQIAITILALLAATVVPQVPKFTSQARVVTARANARNLAAVANGATAAGVVFGSLDGALTELVRPDGTVLRLGLGVPTLSATEVNDAKQYLALSDGQIVYLAD